MKNVENIYIIGIVLRSKTMNNVVHKMSTPLSNLSVMTLVIYLEITQETTQSTISLWILFLHAMHYINK